MPNTSSTSKHRWTYEEDKICTEKYFEYFVKCSKKGTVKDLVDEILSICPELKESSVKMKIGNIKTLCLIHNINDKYNGNPLENYSEQNREAFLDILKK